MIIYMYVVIFYDLMGQEEKKMKIRCELYARHISAALGGADAGSNSNVNAYLTSVNVVEV